MTGYHIQATDGDIGHVEDFLVDDHSWAIRYMIVDTTNWWAGKKVLVAPAWIKRVDWAQSKVHVTSRARRSRPVPSTIPPGRWSAPTRRDYTTTMVNPPTGTGASNATRVSGRANRPD